jgi:hypothetical protein
MKILPLNLLLLLILVGLLLPAQAANNSVNVACKRLCDTQSECVRKCVAHAELFELNSDFVNATADWSPDPEIRMKVLRTGANVEILALCKQTGWSLDNMLTCLRSYPTPEVIKSCKKLSTGQEEQVRCIRMGKTSAEIEACTLLAPSASQRLECLGKEVTAQETRECRRLGPDIQQRMQCLDRARKNVEAEAKEFQDEARHRVAEEARKAGPAPASVKK